MARKRASMREGPLADLFRSTEESVKPDEVKVTARKNGAKRVEVAVEETVSETPEPGPEPVPEPTPEPVPEPTPDPVPDPLPGPEPVPEPTPPEPVAEDEPTSTAATKTAAGSKAPEVYHEGLDRLMGGSGLEVRPRFGRDEPDTDRPPAKQPMVPRTHQAVLRVVGVGGAGVNAVNRMVEAQLPGVEFVAINTDLQSLQNSNADITLHIGGEMTRGLGAGSDPKIGYSSAFEEQDKIKDLLKGSDMVFLACGAGGGTGTGAAPVVAKLARDIGSLTVAAVTKPFTFEGARRMAQAEEGIAALAKEVDTMICVPNERLLKILERRTTITDAFRVADDVLRQAVQGISDLVMLPGLINLDFADVRTTMLESGDAVLGIGMGYGEHRATIAAEKAVSSPLLETSVEGARSLLLSITGGPDLSLVEVSEAADVVKSAADPDANIIFGANVDEDVSEEVWITVIATRFDSAFSNRHRRARRTEPREPRSPDRAAALRPERYADPVGDWRGTDSPQPRHGSADELYGDGVWGRGGVGRRPAEPRPLDGRVLDVPEYRPED
jgi:cell division protein FtsZ